MFSNTQYFFADLTGDKINKILFYSLLVILPLFRSEFCNAQQSVILGRVTDTSTGEPVPFANVYFNNSLTGTTTDSKGKYLLKNLDAGAYQFIVSFVGYESYRTLVRLGIDDTLRIRVNLTPSVSQLAEVEVKGKVDNHWKRQFHRFERNFFGPEISRKDCEILNPWSLNFTENSKTDSFTAVSKVPLEIVNHRLGYKVFFMLKEFCMYKGQLKIYYGDTRFEKLKATTSEELSAWEMNRYNAYRGSLRNFFKDLIDNTLDKDDFLAYQKTLSLTPGGSDLYRDKLGFVLKPIDWKSTVLLTNNPNIRIIDSKYPIQFIYKGRYSPKSPYPDMPYEVSTIELKSGRLVVNKNGFVYDPTEFIVYGNRASERAGDMLPFEYEPPGATGEGITTDLDLLYRHLLDSLSSTVDANGRLRSQEEVIVSTDKPYYLSGDDMWFNTRLVDSFNRQPEEGNRIVYVDLVAPGDTVIAHQTLPSVDGLASGRIRLPDYLPAGCYLLHGYTDWMKNFSSAGYAGKTIMIRSGLSNAANARMARTGTDSVTVEFFPEGGTLLASVINILAFRAMGVDGTGVLIKGKLVDDRGRDVVSVRTNAMGLGELNFEPDMDRNYILKVSSVNNRVQNFQFPIPAASESGYRMAVKDRTPNEFTVEVETGKKLKDRGLVLIAQAGGQVFYRQAFFLEGTAKKLILFNYMFPEGVLQLNLFDIEGNFVGQRLVYIDHNNARPVISVKTSKPEYDPEESVNLQISMKDSDLSPVNAWMSVSVTANDLFDSSAYRDPAPEVMLQSEFYEGIQGPGYYFRDTTSFTKNELDNLMLILTQYRYDWRRLCGTGPFKYRRDDPFTIGGMVYEYKRVCKACQVTLFPLTNGVNFSQFATDEEGRFETKVRGKFDTAAFIIQTIDKQGRKINGTITLDKNKPYPVGNPYRDCPANVKSEKVVDYDSVLTMVKKEEEHLRTILLNEVSITRKPIVNPEENDKPKLSGLYSQPDQVIDLRKRGERYGTVGKALATFLTGAIVSFDPNTGDIRITLHGIHDFSGVSTGEIKNQDPMFIVDGSELWGKNANDVINSLNARDVDHIEVYKDASAAFWGSRGDNGVIAIFTKAYMGTEDTGTRNKSLLKVSGFTPEATFKSPGEDTTGIKVDKRITVYWSQNVQTDPAGNVNLQFTNASNASFFTVHVEGITSEGVPFSYTGRTDH